MADIKNLNDYIKTLKRDVVVLQYLLYEKCNDELEGFDEYEYYEELMEKYGN